MAKLVFTATLHRFEKQGEKTGWTYIEIPAAFAQQLKPGNKKSFRVKGRLDRFPIEGVSLLPMGGGGFIMAFNAEMRKGTGKKYGAMVKVELQEDKKDFEFNKDLMECLADEPRALAYFKSIPGSHQRYFSKWVDSAKTETTRTRRIAHAVSALAKGANYGEMLRSLKKDQL